MPLARYFIYVGGVLLALLFFVNWVSQNPAPIPIYGSPLDEKIVRIRSEHKWPQKVEMDTTIPIIGPPSAPATETVTADAAIPPAPQPAPNAVAQEANTPQKHVAKRRTAAHLVNFVSLSTRCRQHGRPAGFNVEAWGDASGPILIFAPYL